MDAADRRLVDKLIREISRAEIQAVDHAPREARRIGEVAPVVSLRHVAHHALEMRPRFLAMLAAHGLRKTGTSIGVTLATLRYVVVDHIADPERAFRTALLDLRHGLDVTKLLRDTARREELFGIVRWCDDWLATRRTLVARVEAQLAWYAEREDELFELPLITEPGEPASTPTSPLTGDEDWHVDRTT